MSDLLTRSTVARFHVDGLLRADIKTRYDVYKTGIESGVLSVELAQEMEGIAPGDVENAPIPFAPPSAVPTTVPLMATRSGGELRCKSCNRLLAEHATPPYRIRCRCKTVNEAAAVEAREQDAMTAAVLALATREQPAPQVTVTMPPMTFPDIHIPAAPPPVVTIAEGAVQVTMTTPQERTEPVEQHMAYDDEGRLSIVRSVPIEDVA